MLKPSSSLFASRSAARFAEAFIMPAAAFKLSLFVNVIFCFAFSSFVAAVTVYKSAFFILKLILKVPSSPLFIVS